MKRVPAFDGLRGLAALAVVAFHFWPNAVAWGRYSTTFFFVLSGYLITGIILDNEGRDGFLVRFYARRSLRLAPAYYLTIALTLLTGWGPVSGLGYYLTYTQGLPLYLTPRAAGFAPEWPVLCPTWSLAVEEQFYLVWPIAVLFIGCRRVPALTAVCVVASVCFRIGGVSRFTLLGAMDGLASGAWLASRRRLDLPDRAGSWALAGVAAWVGAALVPNPGVTRGLDEIAWVWLFYAVVAWVSSHPDARRIAPLRWKPVVWVGTLSYGIYLYHVPVAFVWIVQRARLAALPGCSWLLDVPLGVAVLVVTPGVAWLSWHLIEQPMLDLKRYFEYEPRPATVGSPRLLKSAGHRLFQPISWTRRAREGVPESEAENGPASTRQERS